MRETIRTWDWRAALVEVGPPPVERLETEAPAPTATTPAEAEYSSESITGDVSPDGVAAARPTDMSAEPGPVATAAPPVEPVALLDEFAVPLEEAVAPPLTMAAPPAQAVAPSDASAAPSATAVAASPATVVQPTETVEPSLGTTDGPATDELAMTTDAPAAATPGERSVQVMGEPPGIGTASWFGHEPEPAPEPAGPLRRLWSHPWAKLAVAGVAAAVVVALVVGGIRLFDKNTASDGTTSTTVTQPPSHPAHHAHVPAPISAAQLATYEGFSSSFQNANVAATKGIVKAGSAPTASQIVLVVVAYRTAVNIYNYQLHFIQWPQSMQSAIEADHAQLQALTSFLEAFSSVAPNGVPSWLSLLHDRANSAEVADNVVRQDLGLPASFAFP